MNRYRLLLASVVLSWGVAYGGGSLESDPVISLLKQSDALWSCLGSTLEFAPTAEGVRCGSHWPHMGGARVAPYIVRAKLKGAKDYSLLVEVKCEQHFVDASGDELPMQDEKVTDRIVKEAVRVKEKVTSVSLTPYQEEEAKAEPLAAAEPARSVDTAPTPVSAGNAGTGHYSVREGETIKYNDTTYVVFRYRHVPDTVIQQQILDKTPVIFDRYPIIELHNNDTVTSIPLEGYISDANRAVDPFVNEIRFKDKDDIWIVSRLGHRLDGCVLLNLTDKEIKEKYRGNSFSVSSDGTNIAYSYPDGRELDSVFINDYMAYPVTNVHYSKSDIEVIGSEEAALHNRTESDAKGGWGQLVSPIRWSDSEITFVTSEKRNENMDEAQLVMRKYKLSVTGVQSEMTRTLTREDLKAYLGQKDENNPSTVGSNPVPAKAPEPALLSATVLYPLHAATRQGDQTVAARLIEKGLNVDLLNEEGQTPLHIVAANGHQQLAGFLLEKGAAINAADKQGRTPLDLAIANSHDGMAAFLASKGAKKGSPATAEGSRAAAANATSPTLAQGLKFRTLPAFEAEIKEPGVLLDSPRICLFAPKRREAEAKVVFPYLVKAYNELHRITGLYTENKMVVYAFPKGNPNVTGGTSGPDSIEYDETCLDLASQEEWTKYRVPHVSGSIEEMAHCFVTASKAKFGWEMTGWSLGIQASTKAANNPKFAADLTATREEQRKTFERYLAAGGRLPDDVPPNVCDRIHGWVLYQCERDYGPSFWPDFYAQVRAHAGELAQAADLAGDDYTKGNARFRVTVECFEALPGLQFKERLRKASISLTTDVKSLKPEAPGWNRRLGP